MSRYCVRGRWYSPRPNSTLRYDSGSESESEEGKGAKKVAQLIAINPKQSKIETSSKSEATVPSQSTVVELENKPKIRKNLNL